MRSACFAPENDSIHPITQWQHNADLCAPTLCAAKHWQHNADLCVIVQRAAKGYFHETIALRARPRASVHDLNMRVTQLSILGQFFPSISLFLSESILLISLVTYYRISGSKRLKYC